LDIVLARHGETEWNVGEIFRGRADVDLNDTGRGQARLLGQFLADSKVSAVYSSPLKRALSTAGPIAGPHGLSVRVSPGLNDLSFGDWEGLSIEEVRVKYPAAFSLWVNHPEQARPPGGEMLDELGRRARQVVDGVLASDTGAVVLVTHRVVIKVLTCALLGLDNRHFWDVMVDTCGLTTFRHERGRFVLVRHNDTSFLRPMGRKPLTDF
jgi:broad specificity phosphatase PhoE